MSTYIIFIDFLKNFPYIKSMKITSNLYSINRDFQKINKTADDISKSNLERLPEDIVNLIESQRDVEANLKVIKTESELLGTIIDTYAWIYLSISKVY